MKPLFAALLCASALSAAAPVLAQPPGPPPGPMGQGQDIRGQLENLEHRIQDGDRMHQLDRGEFDRATRELSNIRDAERDMRFRHDGDLSPGDRMALQGRIDNLSRSIHWMRENGPTPPPPGGYMPPPAPYGNPPPPSYGNPPPPPYGHAPPPPPIAGGWSLQQREDWLQQQIDRGRADGSLGRREAYRVQKALNDIRGADARLTRRDGGVLSGSDRYYIQQRLDRLRGTIHWLRDNGEPAPWARP